MLCILLKKPIGLNLEYYKNDKEKFDNLGLKSDLSDWKCYEVLNVPGIALNNYYIFTIALYVPMPD